MIRLANGQRCIKRRYSGMDTDQSELPRTLTAERIQDKGKKDIR